MCNVPTYLKRNSCERLQQTLFPSVLRHSFLELEGLVGYYSACILKRKFLVGCCNKLYFYILLPCSSNPFWNRRIHANKNNPVWTVAPNFISASFRVECWTLPYLVLLAKCLEKQHWEVNRFIYLCKNNTTEPTSHCSENSHRLSGFFIFHCTVIMNYNTVLTFVFSNLINYFDLVMHKRLYVGMGAARFVTNSKLKK